MFLFGQYDAACLEAILVKECFFCIGGNVKKWVAMPRMTAMTSLKSGEAGNKF